MKSPEGDWRDCDAIHVWAGQLHYLALLAFKRPNFLPL
jgi:hypothetical protein